jgi:membrane-bound lytic murein transglycosylase D
MVEPEMTRILLALPVALGLAAAPAAAEPGASPGVQASPPQPSLPAQRPLEMSASQRQIIRGCPVDGRCPTWALSEAMLEFERERFPRTSKDSPWVEGDRGGPRRVGRAPGQVVGPRKPSEVRRDLAWMDQLALPDIPVKWDHRVIAYLEFYKSDPRGRQIMAAWLRRQGRFKDFILRELRARKLPAALLYVAMIESSYDPNTYSRVGASGLWQFMPGGGRIYGLEQNRWLDERNDFVRATRAAALYMDDLFTRFGDWNLALAAYNAGYGAVLQSMAKYNTNDFWALLDHENGLPWESGNYVPKALATAIVGLNREAFGFGDVKPDPPVQWDNVTVPKTVALSVIARAAGTTTAVIESLNPQLRRGRTPPGMKDYVVRIPRGTRDRFASRFSQLRGEWDDVDVYLVRHGERFEDVATEFGISRSDLRKLNGLESETELRGGTMLVVPRTSDDERRSNREKASDDLYASGVPGGEPGDDLMVAVPDPNLVVKGKRRVFYRVVSGDSLWDIARAFRTTVAELAAWNGLDPKAALYAQMVLQVWVEPDFDAAARDIALLDAKRIQLVESGSPDHLERAEARMGRARIVHEVSANQNLTTIGRKYGLSARDLARVNNIPPDATLEVGQKLIVYKVTDPSKSDRAAAQARQAKGR